MGTGGDSIRFGSIGRGIDHLCRWYRGIPAWVMEEDYQKAEDGMWEEHVKNLGEKFCTMMNEGKA